MDSSFKMLVAALVFGGLFVFVLKILVQAAGLHLH